MAALEVAITPSIRERADEMKGTALGLLGCVHGE
jgi:hypothetical protein